MHMSVGEKDLEKEVFGKKKLQKEGISPGGMYPTVPLRQPKLVTLS